MKKLTSWWSNLTPRTRQVTIVCVAACVMTLIISAATTGTLADVLKWCTKVIAL